jgi:hypothetical protein
MSKCATCGTPVQRSTAAAIVWTTPPQMWCFACWDGGDTAVEQYRAAQECTGLGATWCPRHGSCRCGLLYGLANDGERTLDDHGCPLHDPLSTHGAQATPSSTDA